MLRRSSLLTMLLATMAWGEDGLPNGEPLANVASGVPAQSQHVARKPPQGKAEVGDKTLSGMSILGNQEAPKSLVIVPWKSSQLGDALGLAESLDDSRKPVDKEVFMRELGYYEIRASTK